MKWMKVKLCAAVLLAVLLLYSALSAIISFLTPIASTRNVVENSIVQSARYDFKVNLMPNSLYANERLALPDNAIFSKITKSIHVDLNYSIAAQAPVKVKGTRSIVLSITAEQLWRKELVILEPAPIDEEGTDIYLFREQAVIDIAWIQSYIDAVEKEVQVKPVKYTIKLTPKFEGQMLSGQRSIAYDVPLEPSFELSSYVIKPAEKREFSKETVLDHPVTVGKKLRVLGTKLDVRQARMAFTAFTAALLLPLVLLHVHIGRSWRLQLSEAEQIDRKYRKRLIPLADHVDLEGSQPPLYLQSFEVLAQLADDREQGIFRHAGEHAARTMYYVFDGSFVYCYAAARSAQEPIHVKLPSSSGKDMPL